MFNINKYLNIDMKGVNKKYLEIFVFYFYYIILNFIVIALNLHKPYFFIYEMFYFVFPVVFLYRKNLRFLLFLIILNIIIGFPIGLIGHNIALFTKAWTYPVILPFYGIDFYGIFWFAMVSFFTMGITCHFFYKNFYKNFFHVHTERIKIIFVITSILFFSLFLFRKQIVNFRYPYFLILPFNILPIVICLMMEKNKKLEFKKFLEIIILFFPVLLTYEVIGVEQFKGWQFLSNYLMTFTFINSQIPIEEIILICITSAPASISFLKILSRGNK